MANAQNSPCDWCCRGGSLDIGSGAFRDFDSDFSYGIPVCGGCGGVGRTVNTSEFRERANRVMELRFLYCPSDSDRLGPLPPCLLHVRLEALITAVKDMYRDYGDSKDKSFANMVVAGGLSEALQAHRVDMEREAASFRGCEKDGPEKEGLFEALALAAEGAFDEAEKRLLLLLERYPESSILHHDCGGFFKRYRRDAERALSFLLRSTELHPQKSLHFWQAAELLTSMKRERQAIDIVVRMRKCPDFESLPGEIRRMVNEHALLS